MAKIKAYHEKNAIAIKGSSWTLWLRKVKNSQGETLYLLEPLEAHYNPNTQKFHYEPLKNPIWLQPQDFGELISTLIQMRNKEAEQ